MLSIPGSSPERAGAPSVKRQVGKATGMLCFVGGLWKRPVEDERDKG